MCTLLLGFTGAEVARAGPARWTANSGPVARIGSAVGFSDLGDDQVSTLGGQAAIGYRLGPVTLEAQYDRLSMLEYVDSRNGNTVRGELQRWGVNARVYALGLGLDGGDPDPDSVLRLYAEIGLGRQTGLWSTGDAFARRDTAVGAGWLLDHRMRPRPGGMALRSIGWHFGWQVLASQAEREDVVYRTTCKSCRPPMPGDDTDTSLLVSCALIASW